jgi:hypothetical protein
MDASRHLKLPRAFYGTVEALATLRFRHLDYHYMKPGDFEDISVSKIPHFFQRAGLLNK